MPNDEELLGRLDATPFSELTDDEIAALVDRAAASPAVREALAARIRLERTLHAHLEVPDGTSTELLRSIRPRQGIRKLVIAGGLSLCLAIAGLFAWWNSNSTADPRTSSLPPIPREHASPERETALVHMAESIRSPVEARRPKQSETKPAATQPQPPDVSSPPEPLWHRMAAPVVKRSLDIASDFNKPPLGRLLFAVRELDAVYAHRESLHPSQLATRIGTAIAIVAPEVPRRFQDHPLSTEPNREGVTLSLELEAALNAGALADAARLVPAVAEVNGLVPALGAPDRLIPPATLIETAVAEYPDLAEALEQTYGQNALQAIRQAISVGNHAAVERIAIRYHGTRAAGEARRCLGELALAQGRPHEASRQFQAALAMAPGEEHPNLRARIDLAAALSGSRNPAPPGMSPVTIGPMTIPPDRWNALIAEINNSHAASASQTASPKLPRPGPHAAGELLQLVDNLGRDVTEGNSRDFDWAGRQLAVTVHQDTAYISNRFQVIAYRLPQQATAWTNALGAEQGDAHAWPNIPFKPLIVHNQLIVRRLTGRGPELAALSRKEGTTLWRSDDDLTIASEPWVRDGTFRAITTPNIRHGDRPVVLSLTRFRIDDGQVLSATPLFVLNPNISDEPAVQVTPLPRGVCLFTRGAAGCFEDDGQIRWLRRLPFLPKGIDPRPGQVAATPPILVEDRIYLALPETRQILCLDIASGDLLWSRPTDNLSRLITANSEIVLVRADDRIIGLDPQSGLRQWSTRLPGLLEAALFDSETLLVPQHVSDENGKQRLTLAWLDLAQGTIRDATTIALDEAPTKAAGPFFRANNATYLFLGDHPATGERTLIELTERQDM